MTVEPAAIVAVIPVSSDDLVWTVSIRGRAVIDWTIRRWQAALGIDRLVLAVDGGSERRPSVPIVMGRDRVSAIRAAVALAEPVTHVLLCPADRPLGPGSIVDALRASLGPDVDAVGAAWPVRSTLKRVVDGRVVATVPREAWRSDPGPWLFQHEALIHALEMAAGTGADIVDGRSLVLAGGLRARLIDTEATDLTIRSPADARFAERWLAWTNGTTG